MRLYHQLVAALAFAVSTKALVININLDEHRPASVTHSDNLDAEILWDNRDQRLPANLNALSKFEGQHSVQNDDPPVHANFLVDCGGYLDAMIREGVSHLKDKFGEWPKEFNNGEGFRMSCQANIYFEYPLDPPQRRDRVIFNARGEYCNTLTHRGMPGGGYRQCPAR